MQVTDTMPSSKDATKHSLLRRRVCIGVGLFLVVCCVVIIASVLALKSQSSNNNTSTHSSEVNPSDAAPSLSPSSSAPTATTVVPTTPLSKLVNITVAVQNLPWPCSNSNLLQVNISYIDTNTAQSIDLTMWNEQRFMSKINELNGWCQMTIDIRKPVTSRTLWLSAFDTVTGQVSAPLLVFLPVESGTRFYVTDLTGTNPVLTTFGNSAPVSIAETRLNLIMSSSQPCQTMFVFYMLKSWSTPIGGTTNSIQLQEYPAVSPGGARICSAPKMYFDTSSVKTYWVRVSSYPVFDTHPFVQTSSAYYHLPIMNSCSTSWKDCFLAGCSELGCTTNTNSTTLANETAVNEKTMSTMTSELAPISRVRVLISDKVFTNRNICSGIPIYVYCGIGGDIMLATVMFSGPNELCDTHGFKPQCDSYFVQLTALPIIQCSAKYSVCHIGNCTSQGCGIIQGSF